MPENVPTLVKEDLHWTVWRALADGSLTGAFYLEENGAVLTEKDLASLHPELPAAARAQLRWANKSTGAKMLIGNDVDNQLHYLTQSPLLLPEPLPDIRRYASECYDLQRTSKSDVLLLKALSYHVSTVDDVDITLPVPVDTRDCVLTSAWLDAHFPGWLPRFEAAEFLGLSGEDLIAHVFTTEAPPPLVATTMTDIAFD